MTVRIRTRRTAEAARSTKAVVSAAALEDAYRIGRMLRVMLSQDLTSKLNRYEVTLQKQLSQTLRDLSKLQDERRARATGLQELATIAEAELSSRPINPSTRSTARCESRAGLIAPSRRPVRQGRFRRSVLTMCDARQPCRLFTWQLAC